MKAFKILTLSLIVLFLSYFSFSQSGDADTQLLLVHEDQVLSSKDDQYRKASESLAKLMQDNKFAGAQFNCYALDDFTYWYVSPIKNMAELDNRLFQKTG